MQIDMTGTETRLAIAQVVTPHAQEAIVVSQLEAGLIAFEGGMPATQGLGIMRPVTGVLETFQTRRPGVLLDMYLIPMLASRRVGSMPPGKIYRWMKSGLRR